MPCLGVMAHIGDMEGSGDRVGAQHFFNVGGEYHHFLPRESIANRKIIHISGGFSMVLNAYNLYFYPDNVIG